MNGYIYKGAVELIHSPDYENSNTKYENSTTTITSLKDIPVYDNSSGLLVEFATIKQNVTFPILLKTGNWYAIDVNGRIGYVYSTNVTATVPQPSTPPGANKVYIR